MSTGHQVHGFGQEPRRPDWPVIRLEEMKDILALFPEAGQALEVLWLSPRPFSAAARVRTDTGTLFVKRHHYLLRTVDDLESEHRFMRHLHGRGIPVATCLESREGRTAVQRGIWSYEVHRMGKGMDVYQDHPSWTGFLNADHAFAAGAMLARLHDAAGGFLAPPRQATMLVANFRIFGSARPLDRLAEELPHRPGLVRFLANRDWRRDLSERLLAPFHQQALAHLHGIPPLWTHGDWHASNLLWSAVGPEAQVMTVLDFGLSDRTFALFDVATAIERNLVSWLDMEEGREPVCNLEHLEALLRGYGGTRCVDATFLNALAAVLPLVHADFALSEVAYFSGLLNNETDAILAYDQYLLGHADWFRRAEGEHLLARLRTLARRSG